MKIPKGIEGDYLETKNHHLFFDVKGFHHPIDRKICFLRFYPVEGGDRVRYSQNYKKVYDLNERYSILREKFPQYLFYSKNFDLELQGVVNEDIKYIYTPREYFRKLKNRKSLSPIQKKSKELCETFIAEGSIPDDSIGISGSLMVDLSKEDSDIDVVIYGTENALDFQTELKKILVHSKCCRKYNMNEYKSHYQWRVGGSSIQYEDFLRSEKRKLHQGKFYDTDFFIRYIKSPKDWKGDYYDYIYKNLGKIKLKAKVIDARDAIFTPCSYKIECLKILETNSVNNRIDPKKILEVNSFRGRFCEHAKEREIILVEGKLEKVLFRNTDEYYRILLSNQVHDKMIILS